MARLAVLVRATCGVLSLASIAGSAAGAPPADPAPPAPPGSAASSPSTPAPPVDDRKARAKEHFDKGVELTNKNAIEAAVAEFLEARRLFPTRSATYNAASCLRSLDRSEEALEMYEALLREFPDAPPEMKTDAQRSVLELRKVVGTIEIEDAELGAAIEIDGRSRGDHPSLAPLRVARGSHVIRVYKEGFEPFSQRVDVAGGQTLRVRAQLRALARSGILRIAEASGAVLSVAMDGAVVGTTPWEGRVAVGNHTIFLFGAEHRGTQPASVTIRANERIPLTLVAEQLEAWVRIEPTPADASIAVDSVLVGNGTWTGRLRTGRHKIDVAARGFITESREVTLLRDERNIVVMTLQRDSSSPFFIKPPREPRFLAELGVAVPIVPTLGGDVTGTCAGTCTSTFGVGGYGVVRGGYELGSGLGFGLTVGYMSVSQWVTKRDTSVTPTGFADPDPVTADDLLRVRGVLLGGWIGMTLGEALPIHFRLGVGTLMGAVHDARRGSVTASDGTIHDVGPLVQDRSTVLMFLSPEARLGLPLGRRVQATLGLEVPLFLGGYRARWDHNHRVNVGPDGEGYFDADELTGSVVVAFVPSIGVRYDF